MKNVLNKIISWFKPSKVELPVNKELLLEFYDLLDNRYGYSFPTLFKVYHTEFRAYVNNIIVDEVGTMYYFADNVLKKIPDWLNDKLQIIPISNE